MLFPGGGGNGQQQSHNDKKQWNAERQKQAEEELSLTQVEPRQLPDADDEHNQARDKTNDLSEPPVKRVTADGVAEESNNRVFHNSLLSFCLWD